uniref:Uncharacterized protein n=2 Tax=Planctomycetaceae TaxID=126 RepID=F0SNP2_RUBBR|nr:hypothetical protein Plabr_1316 [Rubinisphaera brasiliensis DSM 5305]
MSAKQQPNKAAECGNVCVPSGTRNLEEFEMESREMSNAIDLPANVAAQMMLESTTNMQANNRDGRAMSTVALGVLQAAAARNFDELGAVESRSTSGVMATPLAAPVTQ